MPLLGAGCTWPLIGLSGQATERCRFSPPTNVNGEHLPCGRIPLIDSGNDGRKNGDMPVAAHASYLINLATGPDKAEQSVTSFAEELRRCLQLGIGLVVIHPGSHGGASVEIGVARVAHHLDLALESAGVLDADLKVMLETTAGQGASLGSRFEELGEMLATSRFPEHLGSCVDTCHIFAAGYDFLAAEGYARTVELLERHVGLGRIHLLHLNDSKKECGSWVDRHEQIGAGCIGREEHPIVMAPAPPLMPVDKIV
ncbi:MAG: deoxyribonuclease IV [Desulfobulbus sp.]|nr:deoxyribonuclease IV [Desulfobulbus sp.]